MYGWHGEWSVSQFVRIEQGCSERPRVVFSRQQNVTTQPETGTTWDNCFPLPVQNILFWCVLMKRGPIDMSMLVPHEHISVTRPSSGLQGCQLFMAYHLIKVCEETDLMLRSINNFPRLVIFLRCCTHYISQYVSAKLNRFTGSRYHSEQIYKHFHTIRRRVFALDLCLATWTWLNLNQNQKQA